MEKRTFAQDVHMWVRDGYTVNLLLKFERTGRYLREKVIDDQESHWRNRVEPHPGQVSLVLAKAIEARVGTQGAADVDAVRQHARVLARR